VDPRTIVAKPRLHLLKQHHSGAWRPANWHVPQFIKETARVRPAEQGEDHMVTNSVRRNLLASTIIAGSLAMSAPAFAQGTPAAADEAAAEGETIVVTGSLISNPNLAQSSPVLVTTAEDIALRQNNVAEEVLRDIPGIVPSIGSAVNNGNGGASFVDLRGLGSNRNIVLLDGNRIVPSGLVGRVDLNNIPLALVERVDALTGGASTTYGADAISGVVNFITKRDFAGAEISVGEKITEKGDGNYLRADVTLGANFDDGRGNAVLSLGYQESDPVYQGDRNFSIQAIDSFTGTFSGSGTTVPSRLTGTRGTSILPLYTQTGVSPGGTTSNGVPIAAGTPLLTPLAGGANNRPTSQINPTTGSAVNTFSLFNFNPYNIFQTPFRRYNMYAAARYEVSDAVELYTRGMFSKNTVKTIIAPSGSFGSSVTVNLNNPYLPAALRNQFCAFNTAPSTIGVTTAALGLTPANRFTAVQTTYTPRLTPAECAAAATATGPTDPNYRTTTFNLSRRLVEGAPRVSEYTTTIFDYRVGARGAISDHINWDVNGSYGESENRQSLTGYALTSRIRQALLANNTTACQDPSNGCVPINVFGPAGSISAGSAAFVQQASSSIVKTSLAQARALISGDFGVASPGATDAINFAVGTEFRKYNATQASDSLGKIAGELGGAGGAVVDVDGTYSTYEGFAELVVPLVQDKPFFEDLTVKGGVRYSHYIIDAPTKPTFNATTYKGEIAWSPVRDIKFRAGYSRAVRAPNISELFTPVSTGLTSLATDPCASLTNAGLPFRAAPSPGTSLYNVCLAQGATPANIALIQNPTAAQANSTGGGNPSIRPEKSDSYTFGTVLTPTFVPGLSITADYYHIKVKNAITSPSSGDVIANCFGSLTAASAASAACATIRRNPVTGQLDGDPSTTLGLPTPLTNLGKLQTSGIDVSLNYRRDLGFTKFALTVVGNYTFESKFQSVSQTTAQFPVLGVDRDCVGVYSTSCGSLQPKFQWSVRPTFSFGDIDLSVLWRHIDKMKQEPIDGNGPACGAQNQTNLCPGYVFDKIKAYDYFDFAARFGVTSKIDITFGVNNVFDRKPPVVGQGIGPTSFNSGNTYPSTYDALGRSFAASAKVRF
jgi:iron complex outermembrane recepter protein